MGFNEVSVEALISPGGAPRERADATAGATLKQLTSPTECSQGRGEASPSTPVNHTAQKTGQEVSARTLAHHSEPLQCHLGPSATAPTKVPGGGEKEGPFTGERAPHEGWKQPWWSPISSLEANTLAQADCEWNG